MDLDVLRSKIEQTEGVLAAWLENVARAPAPRVEVHLALDENDFAAFYARRREWLQPLEPVYVRDVAHPWPGCLVLTREGTLLVLALEPWGSLPEHPRRDVQILFDRTGRLRERLRPWSSPERVEFARLDRLAADVWLHLWEAAILRQRDPAGYARAVAAALDAYLTFVASAQGEDVGYLAWQGELARAAGLADVDISARTVEEIAALVARLMHTRGREVAEAWGWTYPHRLEEIVHGT